MTPSTPPLIHLVGGNALSGFRAAALLARLQASNPRIAGLSARHVHWVASVAALSPAESDKLAGLLRVDPLQVEPVLQDLVALGWCGRLDEEGDQRHVLLIDPPRTLALPLVNRLLLQEQRSTAAFRHRAGLGTMTVAELLV